jgi:hypothetical protein
MKFARFFVSDEDTEGVSGYVISQLGSIYSYWLDTEGKLTQFVLEKEGANWRECEEYMMARREVGLD